MQRVSDDVVRGVDELLHRGPLEPEPPVVHGAAQSAADERPDDRNPGVGPIRRALAGDRQDGVRDARTEIAGRVDRVTGGTAERQADPEDDQADDQSASTSDEAHAGLVGDRDRQHAIDEHERADDLGVMRFMG